jgi:aspartate/methionine/tyrosine aminotransferase
VERQVSDGNVDFELGLECLNWNRATQDLKWRSTAPDIISMASGEHDFEPHQDVFHHASSSLSRRQSAYGPTAGLSEVRTRVAAEETHRTGQSIDPEFVHLVPSISIACALVSGFFAAQKNRKIIFLGSPIYPPLLRGFQSHGMSCSIVPFTLGWQDELERALSTAFSILFLVNPHSPTGKALDAKEVLQIASICERTRTTVLSDDVYSGFLADAAYNPILAASNYSFNNSITFSGYGKCLNTAGVTASFMICNPEFINRINQFYGGPVLMTPTFSQLMLLGCAEQMHRMASIRQKISVAFDLIYPKIQSNPILHAEKPNGGMFLWCRVDNEITTARDFMKSEYGIEVLGGEEFHPPQPNFCRITFGSYIEVIEKAVSRMEA